MRVELYDTTLRDGAQREGISFTVADKVRIAKELDTLGVAFVEAGFPGSNPKDAELFRRAREVAWSNAALVAFGATCRAGVPAEDDVGLAALLEAGTSACTIFGKAWSMHVTDVLRTTRDENLRMIEDSVRVLASRGRRVVFDAEHFFDGAREDETYAIETLRAAVRGGAGTIVLCDTNGGTLPWEIELRVRTVVALIGATIGVHAHDDGGCAVASSLAAVRAGARHVQGTMNGYGERCGNADLTTIAATLELKMGMRCLARDALANVGHVARFVAETANVAFDEHHPYFGASAFAHKGGVHVAAVRRSSRSYEHVDPAVVGNRTRVIVSDLAGRANVLDVAERHDVSLGDGMDAAVLAYVKEREADGFAFDAAEASVALMMRRAEPGYVAPFELVDYKVLAGRSDRGEAYADAAVKVRVGGELHHTAAEGKGPVAALDGALRKALVHAYPGVARIKLEDFKVRILDGREGTDATTRVLVEHGDGVDRWTTVGASRSIVEASVIAVVDGIEHGLGRERALRMKESA